jgi:hypothetical protein
MHLVDCVTFSWLAVTSACSSSAASSDPIDAATTRETEPVDSESALEDAAEVDAVDSATDSSAEAAVAKDDLAGNRDRLLGTYYAFLKSSVTTPQSNGLSGASVTSVCDLWTKLAPSSQATYLTLTARLQQGKLADGSSMLFHATKLYRLVGGDGATATNDGSCGGGEFNRLILSIDDTLHAALLAAHDHGSVTPFALADTAVKSFWRDSHDLGGTHAPFDTSDETEQGGPRGQVQFFADPTSKAATSALGRKDLETLVDPYALEIDQDYDCFHNSNPSCDYVAYGTACLPQASKSGVDIFTAKYGSIDASWKPADCSK